MSAAENPSRASCCIPRCASRAHARPTRPASSGCTMKRMSNATSQILCARRSRWPVNGVTLRLDTAATASLAHDGTVASAQDVLLDLARGGLRQLAHQAKGGGHFEVRQVGPCELREILLGRA